MASLIRRGQSGMVKLPEMTDLPASPVSSPQYDKGGDYAVKTRCFVSLNITLYICRHIGLCRPVCDFRLQIYK